MFSFYDNTNDIDNVGDSEEEREEANPKENPIYNYKSNNGGAENDMSKIETKKQRKRGMTRKHV